jgi:hypothetical protein
MTSNSALLPGVGVAVCDDTWNLAVVMPRGHIRHASGAVAPGGSLDATVRQILPRIGFQPGTVGVSHHDRGALEPLNVGDALVVTLSPTVATLAGIPHAADKGRTILKPGSTGTGAALLKIGPRRVTWATDGHRQKLHELNAGRIAQFTPVATLVSQFIGSARNSDPVELLGNRGWRNTAAFMANSARVQPAPLTRQLLEGPSSRKHNRVVAAHLCTYAMRGDQFCEIVASHMLQLFSGTVAHVAKQVGGRQLFVQCNAISSIDRMSSWVIRHPSLSLGSVRQQVTLIGPRPQETEALGSSQLASRLIAA